MKKFKMMGIVFIMALLVAGTTVTVAAKTKLKVNTIYTTAKKVKGTTKLKKAKVVAKIGKNIYKAKSNGKGKFTIKIKKQKKGTKVKVIAYKGKKKYAKKIVKVKTWRTHHPAGHPTPPKYC